MLTPCLSTGQAQHNSYVSPCPTRKTRRADSATNLQLPRLASGCCFLLSGKVAGLIGNRTVSLSGCLVMTVSLAAAGGQFIVFRAIQGLGAVMCLPTKISIWTSAVPKGRLRNLGFACLSFSSPIGLRVGFLLLGAFGEPGRSWTVLALCRNHGCCFDSGLYGVSTGEEAECNLHAEYIERS